MLNMIKTALGLLAVALLAACGSGKTFEPLQPSRFLAVGDGTVAQTANARFTVNDATVNIWAEQMAARFGRTLSSAATGGFNYAAGNACVSSTTAPCGSVSITNQVDTLLASAIGGNDVVVVGAGVSDLLAQGQLRAAGTITDAQLNDAMSTAGRQLAAQVRRIVNAGGKYVVVAGTHDFGRTPFAISNTVTASLSAASLRYTEQIKTELADLGANVLFVDSAAHYNTRLSSPGSYGLTNTTLAVCTTPDASSCTSSTLVSGVTDYNTYLYADNRHFTPKAQRDFGDFAYDRMKNRW